MKVIVGGFGERACCKEAARVAVEEYKKEQAVLAEERQLRKERSELLGRASKLKLNSILYTCVSVILAAMFTFGEIPVGLVELILLLALLLAAWCDYGEFRKTKSRLADLPDLP